MLAISIVAPLAFAAPALAGPKTTEPSKRILALVQIKDTGISLTNYSSFGTKYSPILEPHPSGIPRGNFVSFTIINMGKKTHNFKIFGKTTKNLAPGKRAHMFFAVNKRGNFKYSSTLDKGKGFTGYLQVV